MQDVHENPIQKKSEKDCPLCTQHHDVLGRIIMGVIIIWLGITLFLNNQNFFYDSWWAYFLLGLGIIFLAEAIVRMTRPEFYGSYTGKVIAGSILIAIGAGHIYELEDWWPLLLIVVGAIIIFLNMKKREQSQNQQSEK